MKVKILIIAICILILSCRKRQYYTIEISNSVFKSNVVFQSFEDLASPKFRHLIASKVNIDGDVAHIVLRSETPNLKEYQMKVLPTGEWLKIEDSLDLKLNKIKYELVFRTINMADVSGPECNIIIDSR